MKKLKKFAAVLLAVALCCGEASAEAPAPIRGERTVKNLLATALEPIGGLMYVWAGGHSASSRGGNSGPDTTTLGLGSRWKPFYDMQTFDYDWSEWEYRYRDGLDCSAFVGWVIYNTLNDRRGREGYVMKSTAMSKNYANRGWGSYIPRERVEKLHAGDIMSTDGHVYIGIGECGDGSRVLVHASPPAVQISGTAKPGNYPPEEEAASGDDEAEKEEIPVPSSEAIRLADYYMAKYWPSHHNKFPKHSRWADYITDYDQMVWTPGNMLRDPEGLQGMDAYHVLKLLFNDDGLIMRMPEYNVIINGKAVDNEIRQYPILNYEGITYFPLTWNDCHFAGMELSCDENGEYCLFRIDGASGYLPDNGDKGALVGDECGAVSFDGQALDGGEYPTIQCGEIIYLPLTANIVNTLQWELNFTDGALYLSL